MALRVSSPAIADGAAIPELNLGVSEEEEASREGDQGNPKRPKAGR